jgi:hypothetical protein
MAVQVSTAALDLLAKTAEMERMVFQGVADPLATLAPLVLPVKTARTAFAGQLVFPAKVVSTERTAAMVWMVIPGCLDETAATAVTAMTAEMVLLVQKEIRVTLVLRALLES